MFHIVHTPIHLHIQPHCEDWQAGHGVGLPHNADCIVDETLHGDDLHDRHPAAQHKFKMTQPARAMVVEMVSVQAVARVSRTRAFRSRSSSISRSSRRPNSFAPGCSSSARRFLSARLLFCPDSPSWTGFGVM